MDDCEHRLPRQWGEFTDEFEFIEHETYYDGPVQGLVKCRRCDQVLSYHCSCIIDGYLWHWTLYEQHAPQCAENDHGLSIVEDRRTLASSQCSSAWLPKRILD